ncbi:MAG: hypothetical protein GY750_14110 [Lentisphaerae bacterium]|nr:hypothetical protein [Lentisphaerota bacterium]MCP4102534.1 hypothetical protein [Lentisphaerota bacterium]
MYISFAAFSALATYVKDFGNRKLFIAAIIFMSVSIGFFVAHELRRAVIFSKYSSNKANAIENLSDKNLLKPVHETYKVTSIRFQKIKNCSNQSINFIVTNQNIYTIFNIFHKRQRDER